MSRNSKDFPQVSLRGKLEDIERRLGEMQTRIDDLYGLIAQVQRGGAGSMRGPPSSQVRILKYMEESSGGNTMKEIQSKTGLAKATVSTGLKNLMDIGAIQKIPSFEKDARYKYVIVGELPHQIRRMLELLENEY